MSNDTVRLAAIISSIWTLIQSVVYLAIASFGISIYQCNLNWTKGNSLQYGIYLVYLYNEGCYEPVNLGHLDPALNGISLTFASNPFTSLRTYDWFIVYIVVSSFWILTSAILFFGAIFKCRGNGLYITIIPWALITVLTLFTDAIGGITYAIDIPQTLTWNDMIKFIGASAPALPPGGNVLGNIPWTWIPSCIMVLLFSRFVIFWIVNLVILISVIVEGNGRNNKVEQYKTRQAAFNQFGNRTRPENEMQAARNKDMDPNLVQSMKRTFSEELHHPSRQSTNNYAGITYQSGASTLKMEYDKRQNRVLGPEELRSQHPWSYFQDRNESKKAPRRMTSIDTEDVAPPVPVPDYTLHFPKRHRENEMGMSNKPSRNSSDFRSSFYDRNNIRPSTTPSMNPYG